MSKSSKLDKTVKRYILDCIDGAGYDMPEDMTRDQKIEFLKETFYSEYGHEVKRHGEHEALKSWFMGLPSACTIEFMNSAILKLAIKWGSLSENASEREQDKILDNYWNLMAAKTGQLFRGYNVPTVKQY